MTLKSIPLSALCPPKDNPRRSVDDAKIASLAESIKTDGVLQNLIVEPAEGDNFKVVSGNRRFLALKLLEGQGVIDGNYKVPVEIRRNLTNGDGRRIAIVENVQRADLDPIDEAEAFAEMLQNGGDLDDLSTKSGLSQQTIRRRLALAGLCGPVKEAVRKGELSLGIAESMTLGTEDQQQALLNDIKEGADLDRDAIREMLLTQKPSAAVAIFPLEKYTGTFTRDLFGDDESTFFDDVEQFFVLQNEAVEALAEKHCKKAAWVDVLNTYAVNWWLYREAEKGEPAGVVINLKPTGLVEVKKGLARHEVTPQVVEATRETPEAPKERAAVSSGLIRYVALQKSMALQAALLASPRKLKKVAATCLLLAFGSSSAVRIEVHPCLTAFATSEKKPQAFALIHAEASRFLNRVGMSLDDVERLPTWTGANGNSPLELYEALQTFSNEDLERITELVVLLSFGQYGIEKLDTEKSMFNRVAADVGLALRDWWTPDEEFLALMRKDQLEAVAIESGASLHMGKFKDYSKKELVSALARYFERTADPTATLDEHDQRGRVWLPGAMAFPGREAVIMADSG
jgi:ParB family chromosome partitioning protein